MKKKAVLWAMVLATALSIMPVHAKEATTQYKYETNEETGGITITEYMGSEKKVTIPETMDGKKVTTIAEGAFERSKIEDLTIPKTVLEVDSRAFAESTKLSKVTLKKGLTSIGGEAFEGCTSLTTISIPSSVEYIRYDAFGGCTGLKKITLRKGLKGICDSAFWNCSALESVKIPSSVTSLGTAVFVNCDKLKEVYIPAGVEEIGYHAIGYKSNEGDYEKVKGLTLVGFKDTKAAEYAKENDIAYSAKTLGKVYSIKVSGRKRGFDVTYKEPWGAMNNQVRISTRKSMKDARVMSVKEATNVTLTGLESKKTYYIQVRASYTNPSNQKVVYGNWSSVKKAKTK